MKTYLVTITDPTPGDIVAIEYSGPRGGCTKAAHEILGERENKEGGKVPADTLTDIVNGLILQIKKQWMPECFQANLKLPAQSLVLKTADIVDDVTFKVFTEGEGPTQIAIDEF